MKGRVLLVAYPLLPVSGRSAGGAEQILWTLERELVRRGWETAVVARAGSQVSGELLEVGAKQCKKEMGPGHPEESFGEQVRELAERVEEACARGRYDLVLDHSGHYFRDAGRVKERVLATLHLPRTLYPAEAFEGLGKNVHFNFVSESQRLAFGDVMQTAGVIRNGIDAARFAMNGRRGEYVLWLGRVSPEKAPHLAVAAAKLAGVPIVLAGQVYPFRWHEEYWERELRPLVDGDRVRWVAVPPFAEKARLLREARALLVTSQVEETTSLVALEAMASGTPVIAFAVGALREVVTGKTGLLVQTVEEMAAAISLVSAIRPQDCRERVEQDYSVKGMVDGYEKLIGELVG